MANYYFESKRPLPGQELNLLHPLTWGLMGFWIAGNESSEGSLIDYGPNSIHMAYRDFLSAAATLTISENGHPAVHVDNVGQAAFMSTDNILGADTNDETAHLINTAKADAFTIVAYTKNDGLGGTLCSKRSGDTTEFQFFTGAAGLYRLRIDTTEANPIATGDVTLTDWHVAGVSYEAGTATGYVNGSRSTAVGGFPAISRQDIAFLIGARWSGTGDVMEFELDGDIAFLAIWDRKLTALEHRQMATDPYAVFRKTAFIAPADVSGLAIGGFAFVGGGQIYA